MDGPLEKFRSAPYFKSSDIREGWLPALTIISPMRGSVLSPELIHLIHSQAAGWSGDQGGTN